MSFIKGGIMPRKRTSSLEDLKDELVKRCVKIIWSSFDEFGIETRPSRTITRKRKRKIPGKVINPQTDKRLKENRK